MFYYYRTTAKRNVVADILSRCSHVEISISLQDLDHFLYILVIEALKVVNCYETILN